MSSMMRPSALKAEQVMYGIGGSRIVAGVDLDVRYGEVLALVGPNGAGKSTLLGLLAGDIPPTSGMVVAGGRPLPKWSPRELARTRAVLLQANQVAFSFTARQVVEMGRAPWGGTDHAADERAIAAAIAVTDTAHLARRMFPTLSGGEKARVSLARVLAQNTAVVLLDEPTAALDLQHQEQVLRIARDLASRGRAVVVVLHDLSLAAAYADEIAMLHGGRLVARDAPRAVLTSERIEAVYGTPVNILDDPGTGAPVVLPRRGL
ncbi:heme ABC transporter ATP-binding protein [Microbacterium suaedae]|uniref:heme ABC transporter ATP-binding protein n=1 Tax=Microbacterium suaedae TaxID=2067813 RepID=UPI001E64650D|nr:heme ABC transporter ATP-binding protein [Microbacterium suaedae]